MSVNGTVLSLSPNRTSDSALDRAQDSELDAFRRLALQLHHEATHGDADRSVMVVSPDDAGTCAVLAANLSCCMAEELGRSVLLADATREGRLSAALTDAVPRGLNSFLSDPLIPLKDLVLPTSFPDVAFLPCGSRSRGYSPENIPAFLAAAAEQFDFVIVAAGAILTDPFALASAPAFGLVIMLAVENETPTKKFEEANYSLTMCGAKRVRLTLVDRAVSP